MKFDENLAAVHAYLCADGYVIKNPKMQVHKYYLIGLRNTNETLLLDFQKRFKEFFGLMPIICKDGRCRIQNKEIYNFLTFKFSYYSHEWEMPKLSKRNLSFWLRAFFDCEAWVFVKKGQDRRIGLDCVNEQGIISIKKALEKFNIYSVLSKVKNRNIYRLYIYGKDNLKLFKENIDFLHPDKKKRLRDALDSYMVYEWHFYNNKLKNKKFILGLIKPKIVFKSPYRIRINSIVKKNLIKLSGFLNDYFGIKSKICAEKNKHTAYFKLSISGKSNIEKLYKLCSSYLA